MFRATQRIVRTARAAALPIATFVVSACATGAQTQTQSQVDASTSSGEHDAAVVAMPDAHGVVTPDAATVASCGISEGFTPALDGVDDMAAYPAAQQLAPGASLGSDAAAIAWDATNVYATVTSSAFANPYEPLHIYLEAATAFAAATPASGKEYSGLVAQLPFAPTHLIAVRRVSDSGTGAYDGVFVPSDGWMTRTVGLDSATLVSVDQKTVSVTVPWTALGNCPTKLRLAVHVVHGASANEWKDLVPSTHTPWQSPGGGYYEIDLTGAPAVTSWSLR
ncbi:MAG TPA: hypothetical protein VMZ53_18035 [Kofleriaceae bacterium]|nr:hypothetical protein [Kofleriaceae bacterium]